MKRPTYRPTKPRPSKVHYTGKFERLRIRNPKEFKKSSFRTHDIGRKGYSKRIAGKLKTTGKWKTQSLLISRKETPTMKGKLRKSARALTKKETETYKLKYTYKGSKHTWEHNFPTKSSMEEWKRKFKPFVRFKK